MDPYRRTDESSLPRTTAGQSTGTRTVSTANQVPNPAQQLRQPVSSFRTPSTIAPVHTLSTHWSPIIQTAPTGFQNPVSQPLSPQTESTLYASPLNYAPIRTSYPSYNATYATTAGLQPSISYTSNANILSDLNLSSQPTWTANLATTFMESSYKVPDSFCAHCGRADQYSNEEETPENPLYQSLGPKIPGQNNVNSYQPTTTSHQATPPASGARTPPKDANTPTSTSNSCPVCRKVFSGAWAYKNLARHQDQSHTPLESPDGKKTFPCEFCGRPFNRPDARLVHERKHPELNRPPPAKRKRMGEE